MKTQFHVEHFKNHHHSPWIGKIRFTNHFRIVLILGRHAYEMRVAK